MNTDKIHDEFITDLAKELDALKTEIDDDMIDEGDDVPSIQVTLAASKSDFVETREIGLQTGDNSYTGTAYGYQHWAVGWVYRDSDTKELAKTLVNDLYDLMHY